MFNPRLIKHSLIGGLVIAAAGFSPAAQAIVRGGGGGSFPVASGATGPAAHPQLDQLQRNVQQRFGTEGGWHLSAPAAPSVASPPGGFHWDDAGIGAAGTIVLLGAGTGAAVVMRRRRPHGPVVG